MVYAIHPSRIGDGATSSFRNHFRRIGAAACVCCSALLLLEYDARKDEGVRRFV
ncbi:hypothetical protein [Paenibacillus sp. y28]|uniref:hypothetical protein n=1 Tax=Paenibacillus sp. y28 TaxID=3129110 RepID=UPI0030178B6C